MNIEKFDVLAEVLQLRAESKSREGARLVLVEGQSQADARRTVGVSRSTMSEIVRLIERVDAKLEAVYCGMPQK